MPNAALTAKTAAAEGAARHAAQIAETREYARNKRRAMGDELLQQLVSTCPVFRDCWPLAIGIHRQLAETLSPKPSRRTLTGALQIQVDRREYQAALAAPGSVRHNLDGSSAGDVSPEHRARAAEATTERANP